MKFETPIGLGEICVYGSNKSLRGTQTDILVKVVEIHVSQDRATYIVEHISDRFGVQRFAAEESMLEGDPDYDHNLGDYPDREAP